MGELGKKRDATNRPVKCCVADGKPPKPPKAFKKKHRHKKAQAKKKGKKARGKKPPRE